MHLQDVTSIVKQLHLQQEVMEQKRKTEKLETYTSTVSHEFRTPLGTSIMQLEELLKDDRYKKFHKVIRIVLS